MLANCVIAHGNWANLQEPLVQVRTQVFIKEQHVPKDIEWDEYDATAIHVLALDKKQKPIGCARILNIDETGKIVNTGETGRIGRMAVLKEWRGYGLGRALLDKAVEICKANQMKKIAISSQTHAIKFYQNAGFTVTSEAYIDANIWHVDMVLIL